MVSGTISVRVRCCSEVHGVQVQQRDHDLRRYATSKPHRETGLCKNFINVPAVQYHYGYLTMEDDVVRPYCDVTSHTKSPAHTSSPNLGIRITPTVERKRSRWLSFVLVPRAYHGDGRSIVSAHRQLCVRIDHEGKLIASEGGSLNCWYTRI